MKRLSIRILVVAALCAALAAGVAAPIPMSKKSEPRLPPVALEQIALYRIEVALAVFYGGLLLITPAFAGLIDGRLPIEISARGAKFADEAERSVELGDAAIGELRQTTNDLRARLAAADVAIQLLKAGESDNTQPQVGSPR